MLLNTRYLWKYPQPGVFLSQIVAGGTLLEYGYREHHLIRRPVVLACACSILFHIAWGLALSDLWGGTLAIAPAPRVAVHLSTITTSLQQSPEQGPQKSLEKPALPDKVVVTKAISPSSVKAFSPIQNQESPKVQEPVKSLDIQQPFKNEVERLEPGALVAELTNKRLQDTAPVSEDPGEQSIESEADDADSQGASSQYTLVEHPQFAGRHDPPVYPLRARRMGHEGIVLLEVSLDSNGKIVRLEIDSTSGYRSLDKAAVRAVGKWQFQPFIKNGKKIPSRVRIPVRFRLS